MYKKRAEIQKELDDALGNLESATADLTDAKARIAALEAIQETAQPAADEEEDPEKKTILVSEAQDAIMVAEQTGAANALDAIRHRYAATEDIGAAVLTFTDEERIDLEHFIAEFFPHVPAPLLRLQLGLRITSAVQ